MDFLDAIFRFSGVGFLGLMAWQAWRQAKVWKGAPYFILACLSVASLFLGYAPEPHQAPEPLYTIVRYADIPHLIFVWLFALSLFQKDFTLKPWHVIVGLIYSAPIFRIRLADFGWFEQVPIWVFIYGSLTSILLMGHLCISTLMGRRDDLDEGRRKARIYFVLMIVMIGVGAALVDSFIPRDFLIDKRTLKMMLIWPAILWAGLWLLTFNQAAVKFSEVQAKQGGIRPQDKDLHQKLLHLMEVENLYREPDLTIVSLAKRLGVSQHRLRHFINQGLGYRNFSSFVNGYRLSAIKLVLRDPEMTHIPILTLALENGFRSLSPFNKAFKLAEGVTPTEYRRQSSI